MNKLAGAFGWLAVGSLIATVVFFFLGVWTVGDNSMRYAGSGFVSLGSFFVFALLANIVDDVR